MKSSLLFEPGRVDDRFLNLDEACLFLNISRSTIYRYLTKGDIPAHRVGERWKFLKSELLAWSSRAGEMHNG